MVYRPVRDAPPVPVWLAWWADSPPPDLDALLQLVCEDKICMKLRVGFAASITQRIFPARYNRDRIDIDTNRMRSTQLQRRDRKYA